MLCNDPECRKPKEEHEHAQVLHVRGVAAGAVQTYFSAVCKARAQGAIQKEIKNPRALGRSEERQRRKGR